MSDDPKPRRTRRPSHLETEVDALDGLGGAGEPEDPEEDGATAPPDEETSREPGAAGAEGPEATDPDAGAETREGNTEETP